MGVSVSNKRLSKPIVTEEPKTSFAKSYAPSETETEIEIEPDTEEEEQTLSSYDDTLSEHSPISTLNTTMDIPDSGLSTKSEFVSTLNSSSSNNMPTLYPNSVALNASIIAQRKASLPLYDPESLGAPASSRSKSIHTNNDTYSVTDREEEKEDERNSMITKLRKTIPSSTSPPASTFTKYADISEFAKLKILIVP